MSKTSGKLPTGCSRSFVVDFLGQASGERYMGESEVNSLNRSSVRIIHWATGAFSLVEPHLFTVEVGRVSRTDLYKQND
jgi:hypothetical protein